MVKRQQQLQFPELVLENGAAYHARSASALCISPSLLQRATNSPFYAETGSFAADIRHGRHGEKRFRDSEIAGYAHLKTGSLEGVKSIAGYVKAHSGKQWIVVFIVKSP